MVILFSMRIQDQRKPKDSLIYESESRKLIATIGMENFILIDTPDALLDMSPWGDSKDPRIGPQT